MSVTDENSSAEAVLAHYEPYGEARSDWWSLLGEARQSCPVVHSEGHDGFWVVTRHADVATILQDPATFSSAEGITIPHHPDAPVMPPIDLDPPLQRDFRRLLNPHLTPARVRPHAEVIAELARSLVDVFADAGECEFMEAFARPLPAMVLGRLILGIEDLDGLRDLQRRIGVIGSANTSEDAGPAWQYLRSYVTDLVGRARERPDDGGLVAALVHGDVDGRPVTEEEQIGTLMILVSGGLGTTSDAFSRIVHHMTQQEGVEDRLRDPSWVVSDLDEFLRLDAPVQWVGRTVRQQVEMGGVTLEPGEMVMAHLASANRDATQFPDGDRLDFGREAARHLSFGLGAHRCIGSNLARLELEVGIAELLRAVGGITLAPGAELHERDGMSRQFAELPIRFHRRG